MFSFELDLDIPPNGCIKITLPSSPTFYYLEMLSGLYKGYILASLSADALYLYGFDYIYAGELSFKSKMTGLTAGTVDI